MKLTVPQKQEIRDTLGNAVALSRAEPLAGDHWLAAALADLTRELIKSLEGD